MQIRLTGTRADVVDALAALDEAALESWRLEVQATKHRDTGQVQAYGRLLRRVEVR
ncbi:hypothetical protein [Glycomyces xiaoerkulensis]|uniref:hypothetical protein n=1 Tax=Glycomyces xiaoerkulensis TaxID=2038139 RepID=UPI0012FFD664|nr:hypothetical protein [Glycomyces xiaoerkulensis]